MHLYQTIGVFRARQRERKIEQHLAFLILPPRGRRGIIGREDQEEKPVRPHARHAYPCIGARRGRSSRRYQYSSASYVRPAQIRRISRKLRAAPFLPCCDRLAQHVCTGAHASVCTRTPRTQAGERARARASERMLRRLGAVSPKGDARRRVSPGPSPRPPVPRPLPRERETGVRHRATLHRGILIRGRPPGRGRRA